MNKDEAKKLSSTVTSDQLREMFLAAQDGIADWTVASNINPGISKGAVFNILSVVLGTKCNLTKRNMLREFGDFLTGYEKPLKRSRRATAHVAHQEPVFLAVDNPRLAANDGGIVDAP